MKKVSLLLCAFAMLITLAGCKDAKANISDGKTKLVTINKTSISKNDLYGVLKSNSSSAVLNLIQKQLYELEKIEITDAMKKESQKNIDEIKKSYKSDKEFKEALQNAGMKDENDYLNKIAYPAQQRAELIKKYAKDNKNKVFEKYHPVKASVIKCDKKDNADQALKALNEKQNIDEVSKRFGKKDEVSNGKEQIVFANSGISQVVYDKISQTSKAGLVNEVIADEATSSYYVIYIHSVDPNSYSNEAIDAISNGAYDITNDMLKFYADKYKLEIYDIDAYNQLKASNPDLIK